MFTFGSDIEVFLKDKQGYRSAIGLIGGSKEEPMLVDGGNLQEDNVLAEFAINPVSSEDEWFDGIKNVLMNLIGILDPINLEYEVTPSVEFPEEELNSPKALEFGCDPDFCVYTMEMNVAPDINKVGRLRTAGGHIHIGGIDKAYQENVIKLMDLFCGIPSVIMDGDKNRRKVYGKAGAFRDKSYGVEYRTLSNFWIKDERTIRWAFQQAKLVTEMYKDFIISDKEAQIIQQTINTGNEKMAHKLISMYGVAV